jgi:hypothetical protein
LFSKAVFNQTERVFVGLRFSNGPFELLQGVGGGVDPSVPFFTVLDAARSGAASMQPGTTNNILVLGPRQIGSGEVVVQIAVKWGTETETTAPGTIIEFGKIVSAAYGLGLPGALASTVSGLNNSDRRRANDFFNSALSFDSNSLAGADRPSGRNSETFTTRDFQLGRTLEIKVFDKDARYSDRQEILHFSLVPEFRPSVIPNTPNTTPGNSSDFYRHWTAGGFRSPIVSGQQYRNTTAEGLLDMQSPDGASLVRKLSDTSSYGDTCQSLVGTFARLGFNLPDQYALTWAVLTSSAIMRNVRNMQPGRAEAIFSNQPDCPDGTMNQGFIKYNLGIIQSPLEYARNSSSSPQYLALIGFARAWARQSSIEAFLNPTSGNVFLVEQESSLPLLRNLVSPATSDDLKDALASVKPTSIGNFARDRGGRVDHDGIDYWCIVITSGVNRDQTHASIGFENGTAFVRELNIGSPSGCPKR